MGHDYAIFSVSTGGRVSSIICSMPVTVGDGQVPLDDDPEPSSPR